MGLIQVKDVISLLEASSILVSEGEPIELVIERFAKDSKLLGIFVIDESRRYKGVITRFDLLQWTKRQLGDIPEGFDWKIIDEFKANVRLTKALDVVSKGSVEAYVRMNDPISKALSLLILYSLIDLPVLNETGEIIGDLNLSELVNKILKDTETELRQLDA
jgi:CBS-domain-containing membrane protein